MENLPDELVQLIDRFKEHLEQYKGVSYDEANTRTDFIDPLFKLLGWDVANTAGYAEQYREVIREDKVSIEGGTKAPDYCFRIGGVRKFFVEAKKPSVDLRNDPSPAYQLRRYAYSAKLPLSILTDFQEFAVYDTRIKPSPNDSASVARIQYFTFEAYPEKWAYLTSTFSRDAILHGAFDKYVEDTRNKHGTGEVDKEFLNLIDQWREKLARNIALRNRNLPLHQLNFAVQKTIDRIVFLRIAEDRGIDIYGTLHSLLNGTNQYTRLLQLFTQADVRYNGGLFNFAEDTLTPGLTVDDNIIKDIVRSVYYPQSPYEFSVLDVAILGNIYEQFLGKTIRLTTEHRVKVEEKPEVKKAGGVYYTPRDIVEYIVDHTVGEALKETTPTKVEQLHILDPACGSGSFLLGTYDKLLSWHLDWYAQDTHRAKALKDHHIIEPRAGDYRLTIDEKRRILTNNIYGVDIDDQAVEIAKLSLTLRLLEGETSETAELFTRGGRQRLLPKLETNIKCGNSLIGPDFYSDADESLFVDEETRYRINAFDWRGPNGFKQVFDTHGGFDVVLGNPPYVRQEGLGPLVKGYLKQHYSAFHGVADLYVYFIERGMRLLKPGGMLGIIVANKWLRSNYGQPLRHWLKQYDVQEITDFGDLPVFQGITTYPCIIRVRNLEPSGHASITHVTEDFRPSLTAYVRQHHSLVEQSSLADTGWILSDAFRGALLARIECERIPLGQYLERRILYGIKTGLNEAFVIDSEIRAALIAEDHRSSELIKPFVVGRDIKRYEPLSQERFLITIPRGWTRSKAGNAKDIWSWLEAAYPAIAAHLKPFAAKAEKRGDKGEYWWELRACSYYDAFEKPKIMLPDISSECNFTLDTTGGIYGANTAYIIESDDRYLLGILNSSLMTFVIRQHSMSYRGGYIRFFTQFVEKLPIRTIDFTNPTDKAMHDEMVRLVDLMLTLHRQLAASSTDREKSGLQLQIAALDHAIDSLVFRLYGLVDEEIQLVDAIGYRA
jgi:hypothetical protein